MDYQKQKMLPLQLKGPFLIQNGQARIVRIQTMLNYTPPLFQATSLQALRQLLTEFQAYAAPQLTNIQRQLQRQIEIKQDLLIDAQKIAGMTIYQVNDKISDLMLKYDIRLRQLIAILEEEFYIRLDRRNGRKQKNQSLTGMKTCVLKYMKSLSWLLPSFSAFSSANSRKAGKFVSQSSSKQKQQQQQPLSTHAANKGVKFD